MPASTKPSSVTTWATSATGIARTVAPPSLLKTDGVLPGDKFAAQYLNSILNHYGSWLTYLNDYEAHALTWTALQTFSLGITVNGAASFTAGVTANTLAVTGNATVGGTLGVTGNATMGGTLGVTGALSAASSTLSGALTAASAAISGNATVGGTLGVTGGVTVGGSLGVTALATFTQTPSLPTPTIGYPSLLNGMARSNGFRKFGWYRDACGLVHIEGFLAGIPFDSTTHQVWAASGGISIGSRPACDFGVVFNGILFTVKSDGSLNIFATTGTDCDIHISYLAGLPLAP